MWCANDAASEIEELHGASNHSTKVKITVAMGSKPIGTDDIKSTEDLMGTDHMTSLYNHYQRKPFSTLS
jgi:hypothetical protein